MREVVAVRYMNCLDSSPTKRLRYSAIFHDGVGQLLFLLFQCLESPVAPKLDISVRPSLRMVNTPWILGGRGWQGAGGATVDFGL